MQFGRKQTIGENLLYVMVWGIILLVPVLNSEMLSEPRLSFENIFIAWRKIAPYLTIFIIHNYIIAPRLVLRRRYVAYLLADLVLTVFVFSVVEYFARKNDLYIPVEEYTIAPHKASITDLAMYWNVLLGLFMTGANTGIKFIYQSMRDEQELEMLKRQNLQVEMDYLKYQINPHFFMNTLNNIHALIDIDTESAKSAVIELSKMMRYVLYDSGREQISLEKDLQFIRTYIELMRIRYPDRIDIRFISPVGMPESVSIPPLLLIVFVENAFKHGVSYNSKSFIHIEINYADGRLETDIVNSRHHAAGRTRSGGIGLENVRKRLDLIYHKDYELTIDDAQPDRYRIHLTIPVTHA